MSLDTKHRPTGYDDVLGQEATKTILRRFVALGKGFEQSYLFAGPYGSGKTTLGRILARALLCDSHNEGNPCDKCPSCLALLAGGSVETFFEVDAATNSGKADVKAITEEIQYATFSGKRRIYLFDESHQLSPGALDALLKPLEENIPGSADKKLVCIFCTTEPERMRATILSRCAPAFVVRTLTPDVIADRLAVICKAEEIEYDESALRTIAEMTECHIRDAIKAVEGVRMLGPVNLANVSSYLNLDSNALYLDILEKLADDLPGALEAASLLVERVSPSTCYQRLASAAMMAYQVYVGAGKLMSYWDTERVKALSFRGDALLGYASRFATRPGRPTSAMLLCDVASLHHLRGTVNQNAGMAVVLSTAPATGGDSGAVVERKVSIGATAPVSVQGTQANGGNLNSQAELRGGGVNVDPRAVRKFESSGESVSTSSIPSDDLEAPLFCRLLGLEIAEQSEDVRGSTGLSNMDRP
jgi:DNA polymerase III subunit gamma/tau